MLLDSINSIQDIRRLTRQELHSLSDEIRERIIQVVSRNGGHLASNLGIVELTLAVHRVFDSPRDKIIFDVGHQCYTHKMITGRLNDFPTLRTLGGLSGFPKIAESVHDPFDTGHGSTSISAALGMAVADLHFARSGKVVAIIGDGAMTGGMVYEAMNHVGQQKSEMVVILNDNEMSISPNVGALSRYLHKIRLEPYYTTPKDYLAHLVKRIPGFGFRLFNILSRLEGSLKYLLTPGMLFEEFGFKYLGPIDGYDFELMERTFTYAKRRKGPVLVHVKTEKGRGYQPATERLPVFHGVGPFEITTGNLIKEKSAKSYTAVFGETVVEMGKKDPDLVAVTAAMTEGTGLNEFARLFPDRFFDVGIAEEHAVTFAAGMARSGLKPIVAIYSTFMQRAIDQLVHDVALMKLPVIFCLDRGGLVGEDGPTHHGIFDLAYLRMIPNFTVMSPKDELELRNMLWFAHEQRHPVAIRYPRGAGIGSESAVAYNKIAMGKAEVCRKGAGPAIWALGSMLYPALEASESLATLGLDPMVINPRFVKPIDRDLLARVLDGNPYLISVEEGCCAGGFGSALIEEAHNLGYSPKVLRIGIPDEFIPHGAQRELRARYGLTAEGISRRITEWLPIRQAVKIAG